MKNKNTTLSEQFQNQFEKSIPLAHIYMTVIIVHNKLASLSELFMTETWKN
jgi:uncharacterized protein YaaR (DUF327 family)